MKQHERKERIEEMKKEIESRGGLVHISEMFPLEITERFLQEVLNCPECGGGESRGH